MSNKINNKMDKIVILNKIKIIWNNKLNKCKEKLKIIFKTIKKLKNLCKI